MREGHTTPFDQIARTDAEGNAYWSARDLMPLMGYAAWREFTNPVNRARKSAQNAGITCNFVQSPKVIQREGRGGIQRDDWHLDRMAAYLVAMNGDPNKPEVAAAQAYFALQTRRAELGEAGQPPAKPPRCLSWRHSCEIPPFATPGRASGINTAMLFNLGKHAKGTRFQHK